MQHYLAHSSSTSLGLGCCTHNTVSSACNHVLVDAHSLASSSFSVTNKKPFIHSATAHCSFILMKQDTNTLLLKMRKKHNQSLHNPLPPAPVVLSAPDKPCFQKQRQVSYVLDALCAWKLVRRSIYFISRKNSFTSFHSFSRTCFV